MDTLLEITSSSEDFGRSVAGIGDFNGDGYDDVLIGDKGASGSDGKAGGGGAYVIFGDRAERSELEGDLWTCQRPMPE